jgi:hypothetical protein
VTDPRIEAVAADLAEFDDLASYTFREIAASVVAAIDAYDREHDPEWHALEADLRERIAAEIEAMCLYDNHENGRLCYRCILAARIARGEAT